jgi:hypothetical protein
MSGGKREDIGKVVGISANLEPESLMLKIKLE